jgi:hypothetical protein
MTSATPPADADENVDASHMQSPNKRREYIPNMSDAGEASFEMNYVAGSDTDKFLRSIRGKKLVVRQTFPNGVQFIYNALRSGYEQSIPLDDKQTATLTLKVSGDPHMTDPTAPRNLVAPEITGVAQAGVPLTVEPGDWAGAMEVSFQWQSDVAGNGTFTDIVGAEGETYVPVAGDAGDAIRCAVTGKNDDFTTEVHTAETSAVVAAA